MDALGAEGPKSYFGVYGLPSVRNKRACEKRKTPANLTRKSAETTLAHFLKFVKVFWMFIASGVSGGFNV